MTRLRHLVVIIPGIGGSVLDGHYDLTVTGLARTVTMPGRLRLERNPYLTPTGLVKDFTVLPPLLTLPGYQKLNRYLHNAFADVRIDTYRPPQPIHPRTDVLRFPYDFRRSVAEAAVRLNDAIDEALRHRGMGSPAKPVIILAHSMGGLVAGYWLAVLGGWRHTQALIGLGVPHRGAPKALDWLVNGVALGPFPDPRSTMVIRGWPSLYELLPQYEAVWDAPSGVAVEWARLPEGLLVAKPDLRGYADRFQTMAAAGRVTHEAIRDGWARVDPDHRPAMVAYLARGHATANLATFTGSDLVVTKDDPLWRGNIGWRGDGTVPALSAIPPELGSQQNLWRVVAERHGPIGSIHPPIEDLRSYSGDPVPTRGGPEPDRPWLGLDIDDFVPAGAETPIEVALLPTGLTGGSAWVTITTIDGLYVNDEPCPLRRDDTDIATWRGVLAPLPVGRFELTVEVMGVPGYGSVRAITTIVALNPTTTAIDDLSDSEAHDTW